MTETTTLFNGRWLRLKQHGNWEFVERTNPGGAVVIVALTDDDHVIFVEQFRVPLQQKTIEMPAGLIGDELDFADEGVLETARRELEEETGYRADKVEFLMSGPSSAGMSTETMAFVRATGLTRIGPGGGSETENITVHLAPRARVAEWLAGKMAEGYAVDPKMYAGIYFIDRDERGRAVG